MTEKISKEGIDKKLITKLANDVWAVAKKMEGTRFDIERELKTISGCLHDIRAGHKTNWYKNFEVKK